MSSQPYAPPLHAPLPLHAPPSPARSSFPTRPLPLAQKLLSLACFPVASSSPTPSPPPPPSYLTTYVCDLSNAQCGPLQGRQRRPPSVHRVPVCSRGAPVPVLAGGVFTVAVSVSVGGGGGGGGRGRSGLTSSPATWGEECPGAPQQRGRLCQRGDHGPGRRWVQGGGGGGDCLGRFKPGAAPSGRGCTPSHPHAPVTSPTERLRWSGPLSREAHCWVLCAVVVGVRPRLQGVRISYPRVMEGPCVMLVMFLLSVVLREDWRCLSCIRGCLSLLPPPAITHLAP